MLKFNLTTLGLWLCLYLSGISALSWAQERSKEIDHYWTEAVRVVKNPDSCTYYATLGIQLAEQLKDKKGLADMHYLIAYTRSISDTQREVALLNAKQALTLYQELKRHDKVGNCYYLMGRLAYIGGNFPLATQQLLQAITESETAGRLHDVLDAQLLLSQLYGEHNEYAKHLQLNQAIFHKTDSVVRGNSFASPIEERTWRSTHARAAINLGNAYQHQKAYRNAISYYETAFKYTAQSNLNDQALVTTHLATCYAKVGDSAKARSIALQSIQLARKSQNDRAQALSLKAMAEIEPDFTKALAYINEAIQLAVRSDNTSIVTDLYRTKADISAANHSFRTAYEAKIAQTKLNDSLFNIDKARQIARLESVNQLEKTRRTLRELELANYRNKLFRNSALVVAVILLVAILIVIFNYRRLKKLHSEVLAQRRRLEQLDQTKNKIFSVIGHDLRSPLNSVSALCDLAATDEIPASQLQTYFSMLQSHNANSLEILDKLTAWGEIEFKQTSYVKPIELGEAIKDSIRNIAQSAIKKNIDIRFESTAVQMVEFNPFHLDFILRNLIQNAIKFTGNDGYIQISYGQCQNGKVQLTVQDNGIGMSEQRQRNLLSQIVESQRGTSGETGLGIGLMLCYNYAVQNGSTLSFVSTEGQGTAFTLKLNCCDSATSVV